MPSRQVSRKALTCSGSRVRCRHLPTFPLRCFQKLPQLRQKAWDIRPDNVPKNIVVYVQISMGDYIPVYPRCFSVTAQSGN